jgi:hypothetical protein
LDQHPFRACRTPVIDIHLAVQDSADETAYGSPLEKAGFRLIVREPDWFEHRMYVDLDPEVNLHVFSKGCPELARCRLSAIGFASIWRTARYTVKSSRPWH